MTSLAANAEPIPVRYPQGTAHGFLVLKDLQGRALAHGELVQAMHGRRLVSRLIFRFKDGSIDDDTTTYSQDGVFRLIMDHHVQKGLSFPKPVDTLVDASAGTVSSRTTGSDGKEKVDVQHLDMTPDVSNGMVLTRSQLRTLLHQPSVIRISGRTVCDVSRLRAPPTFGLTLLGPFAQRAGQRPKLGCRFCNLFGAWYHHGCVHGRLYNAVRYNLSVLRGSSGLLWGPRPFIR